MKTRKKRGQTAGKWARNGLQSVKKEGTGGINWVTHAMAAWLKLRLRLERVCSPASLGGVVLEASPAGWNPADFTDVVPNSNGFVAQPEPQSTAHE